MKQEKSLMKVNENKISKFIQSIKNFFNKFTNKNIRKQNEEKLTKSSSIDDVDVLKNIIDGKIEISNIDDETKIRLIKLCENREQEVREKITDLKNKAQKMDKLLNIINIEN